VKPGDFNELFEAVKLVGAFWRVINEPPVKPIEGTPGESGS
jgi:hypothetical protein